MERETSEHGLRRGTRRACGHLEANSLDGGKNQCEGPEVTCACLCVEGASKG